MNYFGTRKMWEETLSPERKKKYDGGIIWLYDTILDFKKDFPTITKEELIEMMILGE